ncbi:hypothetical protein ANN_10050 [Periplaneta americana]|uniref:Uncharacterized protein n=1 Tax=Periplaneta americana TaxID=6978 RepID=A0ABQ8TQA4_PERAM|nr:hypothetical protein ANN_10050 [Periplaneta americana]
MGKDKERNDVEKVRETVVNQQVCGGSGAGQRINPPIKEYILTIYSALRGCKDAYINDKELRNTDENAC